MHPIPLVAAALLLTGCASQPASPPPAPTRMTDLLHQPLDAAFTPGREVVVSVVEIPPNTTIERHWHPGEEFHYYLEGQTTINLDGQPPIVGTAGTAGHVPYQRLHSATGGPRGGKILVFRIHRQGEPIRYPESQPPLRK